MKASELVSQLSDNEKPVVIKIDYPHGIGVSSHVTIKNIAGGIDWDSGMLWIQPTKSLELAISERIPYYFKQMEYLTGVLSTNEVYQQAKKNYFKRDLEKLSELVSTIDITNTSHMQLEEVLKILTSTRG